MEGSGSSGRGHGVWAIPRLDFIFSSRFERWLLFDSSSSTLSSAERNCGEREDNGNQSSIPNRLSDLPLLALPTRSEKQPPGYLSLQFSFLCLQLVLHLLRILGSRFVARHLTFQPGDLETNRENRRVVRA